jgi:hypothetical protein
MPEKRRLMDFIEWLNRGGPNTAECVAILRSPNPEELQRREVKALIALLTKENLSELTVRAMILGGLATLLPELQQKGIRECACRCGNWFIPERRNHRHYGDHRKKKRGTTPEQKERRRVQNLQAQRKFYDKNLRVKPRAQGD